MRTDNNLRSLHSGDHSILTAVFKNLAVGVVVCDSDGHFVFFSHEAERILGIGATHAESAQWSAAYGCYRPDMVTLYPLQELPLARALRGEEAIHELIFIRNQQRPKGLWIDISGTPLRDRSGAIFGGAVVFSDVSVPENVLHNKAAVDAFLTPVRGSCDPTETGEDVVSDRFARFRAVYNQMAKAVEQTADSILITDSRGIIEYVNPAFEKTTGYSAAEVLGRKPNILKSGAHDVGFYGDLWGVLNSGKTFQGTIINRKKSGDAILVRTDDQSDQGSGWDNDTFCLRFERFDCAHKEKGAGVPLRVCAGSPTAVLSPDNSFSARLRYWCCSLSRRSDGG